MQRWKAHFKDQKHDVDIDIINSENGFGNDPLSFTINGTAFCGEGFDDFHLTYPENYDFGSQEFQLLQWGTMERGYQYDLQRFSLDITIPFPVVNKITKETENAFLHISYAFKEPAASDRLTRYILDDTTTSGDVQQVYDVSLHMNGEVYESNTSTLFFERDLLNIYRQIKDRYDMKCCFTCQWSEYSPYGNADFGTMMCYRRNKELYAQVHDKDTYFQYMEHIDFESKQETSVCDEYEPRIHFEGYRGYCD